MNRAWYFALLCVAAGCGGSSNGNGSGNGNPSSGSPACNLSTGTSKMCEAFSGTFSASQIQAICSDSQGSYSSNGCTTSGSIGYCKVSQGAIEVIDYYYAPADATIEAQACQEQLGTWVGTGTGTGTGTGSSSNKACVDENGNSVASGDSESRVRYLTDAPASGQQCQSETQSRVCTNGSWSAWSGTYTFPSCEAPSASCTGLPTACTALSETTCYSQSGCTYNNGGCSAALSEYDCGSLFSSQVACDSSLGCLWNSTLDSCSGTIFVDLLTQAQCTQLDSDGTPATYTTAGCAGTADPCSTWLSQTFCTEQAGCSWQ